MLFRSPINYKVCVPHPDTVNYIMEFAPPRPHVLEGPRPRPPVTYRVRLPKRAVLIKQRNPARTRGTPKRRSTRAASSQPARYRNSRSVPERKRGEHHVTCEHRFISQNCCKLEKNRTPSGPEEKSGEPVRIPDPRPQPTFGREVAAPMP